MVGNYVLSLDASVPCILFVHWWNLDGVAIIWVGDQWHTLCVIRDDVWILFVKIYSCMMLWSEYTME